MGAFHFGAAQPLTWLTRLVVRTLVRPLATVKCTPEERQQGQDHSHTAANDRLISPTARPLAVYTSKDQGTLFRSSSQAPIPPLTPLAMQSLPDPQSMGNILIIDDVPENIRVLSHLLQEQGYKLRKAVSGQLGIRSARLSPPDLILLDIKMPQMDGYAVCQVLKQDSSTQDIPIIFMSALDETWNKVRAFEVGGQDYITKPFQLEEVLARIKNQMTLQAQRYQLQQEVRQRKQTEQELQQSRQLLTQILDITQDGIAALAVVYDSKTPERISAFSCLLANPCIKAIVNCDSDRLDQLSEAINQFLNQVQFDRSSSLLEHLTQVVTSGQSFSLDVSYGGSTGQERWYNLNAFKLNAGVLLNLSDITARKQLELELRRQINLDGLTQVANRRCFDESLQREWLRCARRQQPIALILCDVDAFKLYNDLYGHVLGDHCLIKVAEILTNQSQRAGDLVARYGGEEFALLLPETTLEGATHLASRIRDSLHDIQIPHQVSPVRPYVTLSFGVISAIPPLALEQIAKRHYGDRAHTPPAADSPDYPALEPAPAATYALVQNHPATLATASPITRYSPHPEAEAGDQPPVQILEAAQLVQEADRLLYQAKHGGRDRVVARTVFFSSTASDSAQHCPSAPNRNAKLVAPTAPYCAIPGSDSDQNSKP